MKQCVVPTFLSLALIGTPACTSGVAFRPQELNQSVSNFTLRRGTWLNGTEDWIGDSDKLAQIYKTLSDYGINEVYLSIGSNHVLADSRLPALLSTLYQQGVRVQALISNAKTDNDNSTLWTNTNNCPAIDPWIKGVVNYNNAQTSDAGQSGIAQQFTGVHLDIEPWIGTGTAAPHTWMTGLLGCYKEAKTILSQQNSPIAVVADVSGSKIAPASAEDRAAAMSDVSQLVLMQYADDSSSKISVNTIEFHTSKFSNGLLFQDNENGVVIAVRASDFVQSLTWQDAVNKFETDYLMNHPDAGSASSGYRGWAVFDPTITK